MPPENILEKLMRSSISTTSDAEYALREVIQEIALLGLSRGDFFSCAVVYRDKYRAVVGQKFL